MGQTTLWIIRHGSVNIHSDELGRRKIHEPDEPVNARGTVQIDGLVRKIKADGVQLAAILSAPAVRTLQTGITIGQLLPLELVSPRHQRTDEELHERFRQKLLQRGVDLLDITYPLSLAQQRAMQISRDEVNLEAQAEREMGIQVMDDLKDVLGPEDRWAGMPKELWDSIFQENHISDRNLQTVRGFLDTILKNPTDEDRNIAIVTHESTAIIMVALLEHSAIDVGSLTLRELRGEYGLDRGATWRVVVDNTGQLTEKERIAPHAPSIEGNLPLGKER